MLSAIFDLATAPDSSTADNFSRIVPLTHVSRSWRAILLNHGQIWSNIRIWGQDPHMLATQISRCQQAPLFVLVKAPPRGTRGFSHYLDLHTNIQEGAWLIRNRRDQVKRLEVHVDCRTFPHQFGFGWPSLREFVWVDTCDMGSRLHRAVCVDPADAGLPRMKRLTVERGIGWPMDVAAQLTTFKLQGPIDLESAALADFFRRNTSLEVLELDNLTISSPPSGRPEEPIELPRLSKLLIQDSTRQHILPLLNLPSLGL